MRTVNPAHSSSRCAVARLVKEFYDEMPFDFEPEVMKAGYAVERRNVLRSLFACLSVDEPFDKAVLDIGCGVGRCAATLAKYYRCQVTGIDLSATAIAAARRLAATLGLTIDFAVADAREYQPSARFQLALALGVLHHTASWRESLEHCLRHLVSPTGIAIVSLYHSGGRRAFREHFHALESQGLSIEERFATFCTMVDRSWQTSSGGLHPFSSDTNARSWFRDQVLHPHETGVTLGQLRAFADSVGATLIASDAPGFDPTMTSSDLETVDQTMTERGRAFVERGLYWHGLFNFVISTARRSVETAI